MFYRIVSATKKKELEHSVNLCIEGGFVPLGSPFFAGAYYHQAMTCEIDAVLTPATPDSEGRAVLENASIPGDEKTFNNGHGW